MLDTSLSEIERPDRETSSGSRALAWCLGVLGIYVGVFVLPFLDNVVLKTNFANRLISERLPIPLRIFSIPCCYTSRGQT